MKKLEAWTHGEKSGSMARSCSWIIVGDTVLGFILLGIGVLVPRYSRPSLELDSKGLRFLNRKDPRIFWKNLTQILIEPVVGQADLARATFYALRDRKPRRPWGILLERKGQLPQLLEALSSQHLQTATFGVRELNAPFVPRPKPRFRSRWIYAYMFGFWLSLHGGPLIAVGLRNSSPSNTDRSRPASAEFSRFILSNFRSPQEFQRAFLKVGAGLSTLGAVFLILGSRGMNQEGSKVTEGLSADLEDGRSAPGVTLLEPRGNPSD